MARRRRRGGGGGGSTLLPMLMQNLLISRRQAQEEERMRESQRLSSERSAAFDFVQPIAQGKYSPDQFPQELAGHLPFDVTSIYPSAQQRMAPIAGQISGAQSLSQLPTPEDILAQARGVGVTMPEESPLETPPELAGPLDQLTARRAALEAEDRATRLTRQNWVDASGVMQQQDVPTRDAASYGARPVERTAQQEGVRAANTKISGEFSPAYVTAQADAQNQMSRLTRSSRAADAQATARASRLGVLGQDIRDIEFGEWERRHDAEVADRPRPADQVRTLQNLQPLLAADTKAREMENNGARIPAGLLTTVQSPFLGGLNSLTGYFPDELLEYGGVAVDYGNTYGYMRSGVTVREDEFPRYVTNLFAIEGDPAEVVQQKQQRRAVFHAATMASAQGDPAEAGRMLGRAVLDRTLPADVLQSLTLSPEIQAGIDEVLAGVVVPQ